MKIVFRKKGSLTATVLQRLTFAASVGFLALSSQFLHAAPTEVVSDGYSGAAESSIDNILEADAELTDFSIRFNLNPFFHHRNNNRKRNSRRIQKGYSNVPRRSFGRRNSYSKGYSAYNSYDRYGQPIYKEYRRKSGSNSGRSFGRNSRRY